MILTPCRESHCLMILRSLDNTGTVSAASAQQVAQKLEGLGKHSEDKQASIASESQTPR